MGAQVPTVDPLPPVASAHLPWARSGFQLLRNPTRFFSRHRARLGDTFLVDAFGYRLFCLFSPAGVRALYALPEHSASKGLADYALLRHKVPEELFSGRRNLPHDLFARDDTETYLERLEEAVRLQLDELGPSGQFEIFAYGRRLGHRVGLASWAGIECASKRRLDELIPLFDRLDASESFVRPARGFLTWATGKRREREAMHAIESVIAEVLQERARSGKAREDMLERIRRSWSDAANVDRSRGVARDIILIHMSAQSNLFAAMAWTLVDLLLRPELMARAMQDDGFLEQCANESIRISQRSIVLRAVLRPVEIDDGRRQYRVAPGVFIATMVSVTNTTSAPCLARYDPSHYHGRRLAPIPELAAPELVTTFGHGRHSCPAQSFSIAAIRTSLRLLLDRYRLEPHFAGALPYVRQLGAVARAAKPCVVVYHERARPA
jgi:cytochrome P450